MDRGCIPGHILDDLCSRFVLNVPDEYKHDPIRIFFQVELAHWFYLDYYCANQAELKQCNIKEFSAQLFRHCPSLKERADGVDAMLQEWKAYKQHVPTYGAVLLDPLLEQCLLVQGFYSKNTWGFPKGKVNEGEAADDCAVREVIEETGFDIRDLFRPEDYIEYYLQEQLSRLYIVPGVPLDTVFEPQTRNEIRKMQWFSVDQLPSNKRDVGSKDATGFSPNNFFMVMPFVKDLKKWIARRKQSLKASDDATAATVAASSSGGATKVPRRERSHKELAALQQQQQATAASTPTGGGAAQSPTRLRPLAASEKQRQRQYFDEQSQLQCKELLDIREAASSSTSSLGKAQQQQRGAAGSRKEPEVRGAHSKDGSSSSRKPYAVLQKDTLAASKAGRKSLVADSAAAAAPPRAARSTGSPPVPKLNTAAFFSKTWATFKLDYDDILYI